MPRNNPNDKQAATKSKTQNTTVKSKEPQTARRREGYISQIVPKTISRTRSDIATWKSALRSADNVDNPRRTKLQRLYDDILTDAHLSALIELRYQHVLSTAFTLKRNGKTDEEATDRLARSQWRTRLDRLMLGVDLRGDTLVEWTTSPKGTLQVNLLPYTNIVPEQGLLLLNEDDSRGIKYRELREYGTWLLEFGDPNDYGLLNKAIPHVLFMRFAQSCWSELCEIYGIPPRVMKTNTQDPEMLDRAEAMMREMGSAAWFIIDENESFEFARGADTNGDVYRNLMSVCKEALSMLINGAVIGQDTVNGNRSKEETSLKLFDKIIQADKRRLEGYYNEIVIPSLERIGWLAPGLVYEMQPEEDLEKLWKQTHEAMQYYDVDPAWVKDKFGIEVTGKREPATMQTLSAGFFD